jgi:peroxiredoxin Q/BCP
MREAMLSHQSSTGKRFRSHVQKWVCPLVKGYSFADNGIAPSFGANRGVRHSVELSLITTLVGLLLTRGDIAMTRYKHLWGLAVVMTMGLGTVAVADDTQLKVKVGDPFPNVALEAVQIEKAGISGKKTLSIADLKGKTVVIFFYPKALTKGCTVESCGFRDIISEFPQDVVVLGASADDRELQQKFIDTHMLPYPLLCDTNLELIKQLGILSSPKGKTPKRITFVIDKQGKIAKICEKVNVSTHPKEVLEFVKNRS